MAHGGRTPTTVQAAQVVGYLAGATLAAAVNPRLAIGIDALTFWLSALLIIDSVCGTGRRRSRAAQRSHLLRETGRGVPAGLRQPGAALDRPAGLLA